MGQPLCTDCYDYIGHVLFTWHAPQLWHRFTIRLRRAVAARLAALGDDPTSVRVSHVKVVELQRRAVPHFHAIVRLDAATDPQEPPAPPGTALTAEQLAAETARAAGEVQLKVPGPTGPAVVAFGRQTDVQRLRPTLDNTDDHTGEDGSPGVSGRRVAAYLAKYVTKSVADFGLEARRISDQAIPQLAVTDHVRRILQTIVRLAEQPDQQRMVEWLHTLGYRGHITSKTRRYSTTMGALLAQREAWRQAQQSEAKTSDEVPNADTVRNELTGWEFAGYGHANQGDRLLARSAAERIAEMRHVGRDELASEDEDLS